MKLSIFVLLPLTFMAMAAPSAEIVSKIQVDAAFPGGNILVDSIEGDTINVHRDLRDTAGDWFYYYFRVRGAGGHHITVNFTQRDPATTLGPAVSVDGGLTWKWLGEGSVIRHSDAPLADLCLDSSIIRSTFHYDIPKDVSEVRFCLAMPYTEANLQAFLKRHSDNPNLQVKPLCKTPKGRITEAVYLGRLDGKAKIRALITARHHACEMMGSYELEGIMGAILADSSDGQWLRDHVEFLIIPFMDKDGVEDGDQGKNRMPHDHNRDYNGRSIYPSVQALRAFVPSWAQGKLRLALDLHCPAHRYPCHEVIYGLYGDKEVEHFANLLEAAETGPLVFKLEDYASCRSNNLGSKIQSKTGAQTGFKETNQQLPEARQSSAELPLGTFSSWAKSLPGIRFSGLIELPYAIASGRPVTSDSAYLFGCDVAKAMRRYFEEIP